MEETVQALFDEGALKRSDGVGRAGQAACVVAHSADRANHPRRAYRPAAQRREDAPANSCRARPRIRPQPRESRRRTTRKRSSNASSPTSSLASSSTSSLRSRMSNISSSTRSRRRSPTTRSCWSAASNCMRMWGAPSSSSIPRPWTIISRTWRTTTRAAPIRPRPSNISGSPACRRWRAERCIRPCRTCESALALLKTFPESPARDQLELQILSPLGTAYIAVRGYAAPQVGPMFQRARQSLRARSVSRRSNSPWCGATSPGASCAAKWTSPWSSPARRSTTPRNWTIPASGWRRCFSWA